MPTAQAQSPSVADLENNLAFIKLDKVHTQIGRAFGMHYISTVNVDGTIYAYFILWYDDAGRKALGGVGLATSKDGLTFDYVGRVLPAGAASEWDGTYATFPGVWYEAGTFYLVYEGKGFEKGEISEGQIGLATSQDGKNFVKHGIILSNNKGNKNWECRNIGTPSLYRDNGQWYLFYHGFNDETCQIGVASGPQLGNLQKYSRNPIIRSSPDTWQSGTAGRRDVTKINGRYYMVYEGSGLQPYEKTKWSSGVAASGDLFQWTPFCQNAALPENRGFGNDGPNFLSVDGANYFYYRSNVIDDPIWRMDDPAICHEIGRLESDGGWSVNVEDKADSFMQFGPYTTDILPGENIAVWKIMIDNNTADNLDVLRLEVVVHVDTNEEIIASRLVKRQQFKQTFDYEYFSLPFSLAPNDPKKSKKKIELRVLWCGRAYIRIFTVQAIFHGAITTRRAMFATDSFGGYDLSWGMEAPAIGHRIGRPDRGGWSVNVKQDQAGLMQYGPNTTCIPAGDNIATWKIRIDNNTEDNLNVLRLEVVDTDAGEEIIACRLVSRKQFKRKDCYEYFSLPFSLHSWRAGNRIQLRVWWCGRAYIRICSVGVS